MYFNEIATMYTVDHSHDSTYCVLLSISICIHMYLYFYEMDTLCTVGLGHNAASCDSIPGSDVPASNICNLSASLLHKIPGAHTDQIQIRCNRNTSI